MELGGNAAFIVFEDADLALAIEGAMVAKMRNGGASCIAANRFYVHESIVRAFADGFAEQMSQLTLGAPMSNETRLGPMVSSVERNRMDARVSSAITDGARMLTGGQRPVREGYFYPATALDSVAPDAPLLREEIFGPVTPIVTFSTEHEVVAMANATDSGLAGYVFTGDLARGLRTAEALETGIVGSNRGFVSDPAAPFGGVKRSGHRTRGGTRGHRRVPRDQVHRCRLVTQPGDIARSRRATPGERPLPETI